MNRFLFAAIFCAAISLIHLIFGGKDVVEPLLGSNMATTPLLTLYVVWHITTLLLIASSVVYFLASKERRSSPALHQGHWQFCAQLISYFYLALSVLFLLVAYLHGGGALYVELPQWLLFIPLVALGLGGSKASVRTGTVVDG